MAYVEAVVHRVGKTVRCPGSEAILRTADRLVYAHLSGMFIEAQFDRLPEEFCIRAFGMKHPPVGVVFGKGSYDAYLRRFGGK